MLKYKKNLTLSQGGIDIGLKVGILAEIGYMLHECALVYHWKFVVGWCHVPSWIQKLPGVDTRLLVSVL